MLKYLPAVGAAFLGVVCAFGALQPARDFTCDRTTCTYGEGAFRVADVRDVRFVEGFGKNGDRAETQLIFASGNQLSVGREKTDDALLTFQELKRFFAPGGPPTFHRTGSSLVWMWLLAAAAWIAAFVFARKAHRAPETYRSPEQKRIDWRKTRRYTAVVVGAVVVIGGAQLLILYVAGKVQGTLILECERRCRFQGMECLPGGRARQSLDEGTYQIDIWAAEGEALWIPRSFEITTGETTTFVCR